LQLGCHLVVRQDDPRGVLGKMRLRAFAQARSDRPRCGDQAKHQERYDPPTLIGMWTDESDPVTGARRRRSKLSFAAAPDT